MTPKLTKTNNGYIIKTGNSRTLLVRPQLRLHRLVEVPDAEPRVFERYWCYTTFEAAVLAGLAWPIDPDTEPIGWVSRGGARIPDDDQ